MAREPISQFSCGLLNDSAAGELGASRANFWGLVHITPAIGVVSVESWPCGQDSQLKSGCRRRRYVRHEA